MSSGGAARLWTILVALGGAASFSGCKRAPVMESALHHVVAGLGVTCALQEDGRPRCFGPTFGNALVPPPDARFSTLAMGGHEVCGLLMDGRALCFGVCGELCNAPGRPPAGAFDEIAVGSGSEACALAYPSTVRCWGFATPWKSEPPRGVALHGLAVGERYACALDGQGRPVCWGDRQPGLPPPPADLVGARMLAATRFHVCAIDAQGAVVCWGLGELQTPKLRYTHISATWEQFCAVAEAGWVNCFGKIKGNTLVPAQAHGRRRFRAVAAGQNHACGVDERGQLECWGDADLGGEGLLPSRGGGLAGPPPLISQRASASSSSSAPAGAHPASSMPAPALPAPQDGSAVEEPAPSPGALTTRMDKVVVPIRFAAARTRGESAIEVQLSTHPIRCATPVGGWQSMAKDEHRVDLILAPLRLEPSGDGKFAPPRPPRLRVQRIGWTGPVRSPIQLTSHGLDTGPHGVAELDVRAVRERRPAKLRVRREASLRTLSGSSEVAVDGTIDVLSCGDAPPLGERTAQPDLELLIAGVRVPIVSAVLHEGDGSARRLVLATGPQSCHGTQETPWDVEVIARFAAPAAQVTLSGRTLPTDLGVVGEGVGLREQPSLDPLRVDVEISLPPDPRRPWALRGIAHARRCPAAAPQ